MDTVQAGSVVSVNFELRFSDGVFVDSNEGQEPVEITIGDGILLETVETALIGLTVGQSIDIEVTPENGYGYANPSLIEAVPLDSLPESVREVGSPLTAYDDDGEERVVLIAAIEGDIAQVDFNHPYAGRTLCYHVEIVTCRQP